ncbi:hypothetical protein [Sinorhizobium meliloti]|uniref:hypothetical protein n=1 Tax=Rhizobium meliloti TaxID=382 RepID=UPI001914D23C|nr:hypothetical protein [Sinorhizobium meliloti]
MVWLVDEHSDEDIKQAAAGIPNLSGPYPRHAPQPCRISPGACLNRGQSFRKTPPTLKIHSCVAQPAIAPKYCGAQFLQHAAKLGFFKNAAPLRAAIFFARARGLGALQHDSVRFSAATPYFFFGSALVSHPAG